MKSTQKDITMDMPALSPVQRIPVRHTELGEGFGIKRALPTRERRMVGAWCFLDHIGPADMRSTEGMHVGAHPHTCLQTFTWMISGQILHRDSLGSEQVIRPGQVNLMTAGLGIAHTEDSLPGEATLHAAQLWIALPPECADMPPAFEHYPELPTWQADGVEYTLLAGRWRTRQAPTRVFTPMVGLDVFAAEAANPSLPLQKQFEYGLLVLSGHATINGQPFDDNDFAYLGQGAERVDLQLSAGTRVLLVGGEPFTSPMTMWWNFVGPSKTHIAQAQHDWESNSARFGNVKGGENRRLQAPALPAGYAV